ncbi:MAG: hypothetical protein V4736_16235 [Bdellovibrionota bacterium]
MVRLLILMSGVFLLFNGKAWSQATQAQLQSCLVKAGAGLDPAERDDAKFGCIQKFSESISVERCASIASKMEYTTTEDEIRKFCIFSLKANPTFSQCMNVAKATEYSENGDEIRWQCLRLISPGNSMKECLKVSKDMVMPYNKRRAADFCVSY